MGYIGDLYMIMVIQIELFNRPSTVRLNDRIDHFGTYIRNQETKLFQNNALVEKHFLVEIGYPVYLAALCKSLFFFYFDGT